MLPLTERMKKLLLEIAKLPDALSDRKDGWGSAKGLQRRGLATAFYTSGSSVVFRVVLTEAGVAYAKTLTESAT